MGNIFAISRGWRLLFNWKLIRKCLSGLSALADKTRILLTKSKDKLCHDEFLSRFLHPLKISKLSNSVSAWSAHEMDSNSSFQDSSYVFSKFLNPRISRQKKVNAFLVNFLVSSTTSWWHWAFYDKWRWKFSLLSLPHILLFVKNLAYKYKNI